MAMSVGRAPGFQSMMKDGARYMSGLEEAVLRNIDACKEFSETLSSAYGPNGMSKMVINHLEKLFVTSDAATIIKELEVEHPAAKMMVMGSKMMEQEVGDGTNFVIVLCGALLKEAEDLLRMGLKPTEVAEGYELALNKALEILPELVCWEVKDLKNAEEVVKAMRPALMSKQYGNEEFLARTVSQACMNVINQKDTAFNVDNVRVCKILGGGLNNSHVVSGMVFKRNAQTEVQSVKGAKIAVYTCPVDITTTETKGTVLINTADELTAFSKGEEEQIEAKIKAIAEAGVTVIVSGGKMGDLATHYLNKYKIMGVRLNSKWDVRRLCTAVGATALPKLDKPTAEECGFADSVCCDEVGETNVVLFRMDGESKIATVMIRGSTDNFMDDVERAVDDGVNTYKALTKDNRLVPGAGATEIELSRQIDTYGETCPGLEQYAIQKFAMALHSVPRILAENSGLKSSKCISDLLAAHSHDQKNAGLNVEDGTVLDAAEQGIMDLFAVKFWGLKYAVNAAATILRVDQIIMAKRAGGPKARAPGSMDPDDD